MPTNWISRSAQNAARSEKFHLDNSSKRWADFNNMLSKWILSGESEEVARITSLMELGKYQDALDAYKMIKNNELETVSQKKKLKKN